MNCAGTVADCLASVRGQSHPDIEQIIVDGASSDQTLEIVYCSTSDCRGINAKNDPNDSLARVTAIISEPDNGIYDAMNKGISHATGEVVGILNADDYYIDSCVLSKVSAAFEDPATMCCYGDLIYVKESTRGCEPGSAWNRVKLSEDQQPRTIGLSDRNPGVTLHRYWKAGEFTQRSFYWGWMPPHPAFFVRRSVYEQFGGFRLDMGSAADYELMLRLLLKENLPTVYIPQLLVAMRAGGASNARIVNRLRANRMDRLAWRVNGLRPLPWTILLKPLRKLSQWLVKRDLPP